MTRRSHELICGRVGTACTQPGKAALCESQPSGPWKFRTKLWPCLDKLHDLLRILFKKGLGQSGLVIYFCS